ncbi:hypothetical protein HDU76_002029 [Blyttiomyces sp. JEL0837]|nr:hypothetical protein HDU76_002029 [Blyttiomyces sp. JEL0837]
MVSSSASAPASASASSASSLRQDPTATTATSILEKETLPQASPQALTTLETLNSQVPQSDQHQQQEEQQTTIPDSRPLEKSPSSIYLSQLSPNLRAIQQFNVDDADYQADVLANRNRQTSMPDRHPDDTASFQMPAPDYVRRVLIHIPLRYDHGNDFFNDVMPAALTGMIPGSLFTERIRSLNVELSKLPSIKDPLPALKVAFFASVILVQGVIRSSMAVVVAASVCFGLAVLALAFGMYQNGGSLFTDFKVHYCIWLYLNKNFPPKKMLSAKPAKLVDQTTEKWSREDSSIGLLWRSVRQQTFSFRIFQSVEVGWKIIIERRPNASTIPAFLVDAVETREALGSDAGMEMEALPSYAPTASYTELDGFMNANAADNAVGDNNNNTISAGTEGGIDVRFVVGEDDDDGDMEEAGDRGVGDANQTAAPVSDHDTHASSSTIAGDAVVIVTENAEESSEFPSGQPPKYTTIERN